MRWIALALVLAGAFALCAPLTAHAATREYWVAAVPVTWNLVPNGHDAITGTLFAPADTVFPTIVYRRYTPHWRHVLPNVPMGSSNDDLIPGPLLHARVGDRVLVHFRNGDTLYRMPHSMHF